MRTKKITYLCLDYGIDLTGSKGAAVHVRSICKGLADIGWKVELHGVRAGKGAAALKGPGVLFRQVDMPDDLRRLQKSLRGFYGPDLKLPAEVRQASINREAMVSLVSHLGRAKPRAIIERLSLMGVAGVRAAREVGIPHLLEVNALMADEAREFRSLNDYESAVTAENEALNATSAIFCVSSELREAIVARGIDRKKIHVLPNAFDRKLFRARGGERMRRSLGIHDRFVLGLVGSLKIWHGVGTLLEAFKMFSQRREKRTSLVIVGDGPETETIRVFMMQNPHLNILTAGAVPHDRVPEYIAGFDAAVAPYEPQGNFYFSPMKVYEYLAMRRPVVASDQGQVRDVIVHRQSGLLATAGDARSFADAFESLYRSAALRERLSRQGAAAVAGMSWRRNAQVLAKAIPALS